MKKALQIRLAAFALALIMILSAYPAAIFADEADISNEYENGYKNDYENDAELPEEEYPEEEIDKEEPIGKAKYGSGLDNIVINSGNFSAEWNQIGTTIDFDNFPDGNIPGIISNTGGEVLHLQPFDGTTVLNANPWLGSGTGTSRWFLPLDSGDWDIGTNDMVRVEFDFWTEWERQHVAGWEASLNSTNPTTDAPINGILFGVRTTSNGNNAPTGSHLRFVTSQTGTDRNPAANILANNVPRHTQYRVELEANLALQTGSITTTRVSDSTVISRENILLPTGDLSSFSFGAVRTANTWATNPSDFNVPNFGAKINNVEVFAAKFDGERPTIYPESVTISGTATRNLAFGAGADLDLLTTTATAVVSPVNATDKDVTWSVEQNRTAGQPGHATDVVSLDVNGNGITLTAIGVGSATVTATANLAETGQAAKSASITVNVTHVAGIQEPMPDFNALFSLLGGGDFNDWLIPDWPLTDMTEHEGILYAGTNFPINNFWGWSGTTTGDNRRISVAETINGQTNHFMQWILVGQSGGRSMSKPLYEPLQGSQLFVTFDYMPGVVNQGGSQPALVLEFLYGAAPLLSIINTTNTAGTRSFGAYAGDASTGPFLEVTGNNQIPGHPAYVDFPGVRALGTSGASSWWLRWYTFGILFDFDDQEAHIMIVERGQNTILDTVTVPFAGTSITGVVWSAPFRPAGVNLGYNSNGMDNMFFFYQEHSDDTMISFNAPASFGSPVEPNDPSDNLNIIQNWFMQAETGATLSSLNLPTHIDVVTACGATVSAPITWEVTAMPWTKVADNPSNMTFNSSLTGIFEFSGTIQDVPGQAYNRMMLVPQIYVEVRSPRLHNHPHPVEWLDRGVVAVPVHASAGTGNLVQWRLLASEYRMATPMQFNVYRGDTLITTTSNTNYVDTAGAVGDMYWVVPVGADRSHISAGSGVALANNFLEIPLQRPSTRLNPAAAYGATNFDGTDQIWYIANDMSVADVLGNGSYQVLVRWTTNQQRDPGLTPRHTGETIFDLYTLEGKLLWRINMGINITTGEHHHVMHFFDLENSGFAHFGIKTADGTRVYHPDADGIVRETVDGGTPVYIIGGDGTNNHSGNFNYDALISHSRGFYQNHAGAPIKSNPKNVWIGGTTNPVTGAANTGSTGRINNGPEFFTVFDGKTGLPIDTVEHFAPYGIQRGSWGDNNQNRSDRFGGAVAFMPKGGVLGAEPWPTIIEVRQHYFPSFVGAYQLIDGKLQLIWTYDFRDWGLPMNLGNHNMSVGDFTRNGYDDIMFGSMVLDYRGHVVWAANATRGTILATHGDAMDTSVIFPDSDELYRFTGLEAGPPHNVTLVHAATGRPHMTYNSPEGDVGRAVMANVSPLPGFEFWASGTEVVNSYTGETIHIKAGIGDDGQGYGDGNLPVNHMVYWTGELTREFLDGSANQPLTISRLGSFNFTRQQFLDGTLPNELQASRSNVQTLTGTVSNNGTKANPGLQADIIGDWRENIIVRVNDGFSPTQQGNPATPAALRVYITNFPTKYTLPTLMHDPLYRLGVSWQNNIYNQPPHLGFYLGEAVSSNALARNLPIADTRFTRVPASAPSNNADLISFTVLGIPAVRTAGTNNWSVELPFGTNLATITAGNFNVIAAPFATNVVTGSGANWTIAVTAENTIATSVHYVTLTVAPIATPQHMMTIINLPEGTAPIGQTASGSRIQGTAVTLNAGTRTGFTFSHWTASPNVSFANANSQNTTFIMPSGTVTITANWTQNETTPTPTPTPAPTPTPPNTEPSGGQTADTTPIGRPATGRPAASTTPTPAPTPQQSPQQPQPTSQQPTPPPLQNIQNPNTTPSVWAQEMVNTAIENNLVPQHLQSHYTQATTRAEFTALAVALYESVMGYEITGRMQFDDTDDVNVQKMGALGVVLGVGGGNFAPNDTLTREQAAVILARLANAMDKPLPEDAASFNDNASIAPWAIVQVGQMQAAGIMDGVGGGMFEPQGPYTREQSIVTLLRLYEFVR